MRKRAIAQGIVASTAILIVGWQTGASGLSSSSAARVTRSATDSAPAQPPKTTQPPNATQQPNPTQPSNPASALPVTPSPATPETPAPATSTPPNVAAPTQTVKPAAHPAIPPAAATPAPASGGRNGTFTGTVASTQYGPVQVQITVASSRITDVIALQLTNQGRRSVQISNRAAPILRSEVLSSQSANVASVSGASYTSDGYLTSLQSALDLAGFK